MKTMSFTIIILVALCLVACGNQTADTAYVPQETADSTEKSEYDQIGFYGDKLYVEIDGKGRVYERYQAGKGTLSPQEVLCEFQTVTQIESIIWEVYSTSEYPDLSFILVISGTNASWTYHIANNTLP